MKFNISTVRRIISLAQRAYREFQKIQQGPADSAPRRSSGSDTTRREDFAARYPGDYRGPVHFEYSPHLDGEPDPGEVVWTWVPYEEDHTRGKDRPVILIGRDGQYLLALMLTSKDHTNSTHRDRNYMDIGSGSWDKSGRASEVKLDRIIRVSPADMRREGAVMDKTTFNRIHQALAHRSA
ncbi:type II toxin-antitoxin system PemK/MazF family toxin [Rothia sp. P7208]|uniref:type II toxin-antitoxin system PemK/MazF family toxin n=1 Tax=Rothia sp. P7208 TaxID=3402660 RepID=UPI003AD7200E